MQTSELEKKYNKLLGDEECINFRPSPNFKHMRKYLKSKFEEANSSPNQSSDRSSTPEEQESNTKPQQATSSNMAQRLQPPLPPNSPPPEVLIIPKQEVEDDEYNDRSATQAELKTEKEEVKDKTPEKTMCRQFARGMCTRGATCIYVHELILSQLPGVYTFCKNFQNTVCNFPKCKFVHASVFEKEHFYRTGYLPPHTLTHLKESNSALGPPTVLEGTPAEASQVFSNPPPSMHPGVSALPTSGCAPPEARPNTELYGPIATLVKSGSPAKREWVELEVGPMGTHEDSIEPMHKKCKTCDANELRLQCSKVKKEKALETSEKYSKHKIQLMKWDTRVNKLIDMLLASGISQSSPNLMNPGIAMRSDKDNMQTSAMLDRMSLFMQFNSRMYDMDMSQKTMMSQLLKMMEDRGNTR